MKFDIKKADAVTKNVTELKSPPSDVNPKKQLGFLSR